MHGQDDLNRSGLWNFQTESLASSRVSEETHLLLHKLVYEVLSKQVDTSILWSVT